MPSTELLLAAGAALARVHAVALDPTPHLPSRPRPIAADDFAEDRRAGRMPSTALLDLADDRVRAIEPPGTPAVFVHGDVWPGNTVIAGDGMRGLIDWKTPTPPSGVTTSCGPRTRGRADAGPSARSARPGVTGRLPPKRSTHVFRVAGWVPGMNCGGVRPIEETACRRLTTISATSPVRPPRGRGPRPSAS
ncbi:phosphotransferase family protein [Nonomuraea maheshkhaliensis]|uniref:phosphotransferase family protein n=1 Tax=Nonomuraea maheshkhaliensis TaxID=419590 RepID=UPI003D155384